MLRDIVELQESEIAELKKLLNDKDKLIRHHEKAIVALIDELEDLQSSQIEVRVKNDAINAIVKNFNNMPWYKKAVFNFKLLVNLK